MSFSSFSFDDVDIAELARASNPPEMSEHDKAVLGLLKRLLQSHTNKKLNHLAKLQQQLERELLFWIAMFNPEHSGKQNNQSSVQESFQQINKIMESCKQQLRHLTFGQRKVFIVGTEVSVQELNPFFDKALPKHADIVVRLCEALPCVIGHTPQLSITAVNRFDERIILTADDLPNLDSILQGMGEVKIDLPNLITLELGLPTWKFSHVVLHKRLGILASSTPANERPLLKRLELVNIDNPLTPISELKKLLSQTQKNAQEKINHTKQQLSLLTKAMLNDDQFNSQQKGQIGVLQNTVRQEVGQLQKQGDDLTRFSNQFASDLQSLLAA